MNRSAGRRSIGAAAWLAVATLLSACDAPEPESREVIRPVKAVRVTGGGQFRERTFPGRAQPVREVELSFRVSGPLIELPVGIGREVEQGEVVAQIDRRDFELALRNVQGQLENARASERRAEADFERLTNVFREDPGATSQAAVDRAREARDRAAANVSSLEASVASARDQLQDTTLRAPFAGTVVAQYVENFEDVQPKQPILRLIDDSSIEMVVNIPESLIGFAPEVRDIQVEFDAFPGRPLAAQILEVGTEASSTTRTFPVTLLMSQPEDFKVLPGMAGRASGEPPEGAGPLGAVVSIPVSATFSGGDGTRVWVVDEGTGVVSERAIEPGPLSAGGQLVESGLEVGEWVVTAGVHYLVEGQRVRILDGSEG